MIEFRGYEDATGRTLYSNALIAYTMGSNDSIYFGRLLDINPKTKRLSILSIDPETKVEDTHKSWLNYTHSKRFLIIRDIPL